MTALLFNLRSRIRAGGPRYMRAQELDAFGGRTLNDDQSFHFEPQRIREFNAPGGPLVQITAAPTTNDAQRLGGGLTSAQLDQAARMEFEEGASINIDYGERLIAGAVASHEYTIGPPKKNEFTAILGEGWGGLGGHGEWEGPTKVWYKGEELPNLFSYQIYVEDSFPAGATLDLNLDGLNWVSKDPTPYSGKVAHQSPLIAGQHYHQFVGSPVGMPITTGSVLYCFVYLDPANPPTEVMLQWWSGGSAEHRAYWGADLIPFGIPGTASRFPKGALPATGGWVRLDVLASEVGLVGQTVDGMAFILFDGRATWDQAGRFNDSGVTFAPGYLFRPGIVPNDGQDVQHPFNTTSGVGGSGSANMFVRLTADQSAEDRPDGLKVRAKCRRVFDFDHTGAEIGYGYSPNPARVAADRVLHSFESRYRNNIALARQKFRDRIYWPSWVEWRNFCDAFIPWDRDGSGTNSFIRRFEAHIGFNTDLSLAAALDQITGLSASFWQDDGAKLIFLPPNDRAPIHHFHPGNIAGGGVNISVVDLRRRYNRFIAHFRDTDDEFLGAAAVEPLKFTLEQNRRERAIARIGEIRSEREFPNMTFSQAFRLIEYRARLEFDNPVRYSLTGMADAFHVLPGDYVTISHPEIQRAYQLCLVTGIRLASAQQSADQIAFSLQRIDGRLYSDLYHGPRQEALSL